MVRRKCGECLYFVDKRSECHRLPPYVIMRSEEGNGPESHFPEVSTDTASCGEFRPGDRTTGPFPAKPVRLDLPADPEEQADSE